MSDAAKVPFIQSERPTGVTILGTIYIVFAILMIIAVAMVVAFSTMMGSFSSMMGNTMTIFAGFIAVGVGILATIEFVIAWALFSGKSWGRIVIMTLTMVDFIIHCATLVVGNLFAIPHIILDLITFFYMWKPNVISYFSQKNISFT